MDIETALTTLNSLPPGDELLDLINTYTPEWITDVVDGYTLEYSFFTNNWQMYCDMIKTIPQKIILVAEIEPYEEKQEHFTPIQRACDILTRKGYCIRRDIEYVKCRGGCNRAIPTRELYSKLKNHPKLGSVVRGRRWSDTCESCREL